MIILIVEDEHFSAMSLTWDLEDMGHTVLGPVDSIEKARGVARGQRADLALVDIHLEGAGDGIELARYLQSQLQIPTLFMTGCPQAAQQHTQLAIGVITKPFTTDDAHRSIAVAEALIRGSRPARGAVPAAMRLFGFKWWDRPDHEVRPWMGAGRPLNA